MFQLKVIVNKLNKRTSPVLDFTENNIIGTVLKGYIFESSGEITNMRGKWYSDRDGYYYWSEGLTVLGPASLPLFKISNLPLNLPDPCRIGIDISHHNDMRNWTAIKNAGISFAYIKLSEGVGSPDEQAGRHAIAAKQNGLKIGYYHFCRPDTRNGTTVTADSIAEADEAVKRMALITRPDLPLVLDLEDTGQWDSPLQPNEYLEWINTFINRIKTTSGLDIMLYSRRNYLDEKLPKGHDLGKYKLWISNYSVKDCNKVTCPHGWSDWAMWQYCEDGIIEGNSKLDINISKDRSLF